MGYILYIRCFFVVYPTIYPLNLGIFSSPAFFRDRLTICRVRRQPPCKLSSDRKKRPQTKKCLGFGGILLNILLESTVYTLHIPLLCAIYRDVFSWI